MPRVRTLCECTRLSDEATATVWTLIDTNKNSNFPLSTLSSRNFRVPWVYSPTKRDQQPLEAPAKVVIPTWRHLKTSCCLATTMNENRELRDGILPTQGNRKHLRPEFSSMINFFVHTHSHSDAQAAFKNILQAKHTHTAELIGMDCVNKLVSRNSNSGQSVDFFQRCLKSIMSPGSWRFSCFT